MSAKTFSGGASILTDRWMRKVFGFVAAKMKTIAIYAATMITTLKIMNGSARLQFLILGRERITRNEAVLPLTSRRPTGLSNDSAINPPLGEYAKRLPVGSPQRQEIGSAALRRSRGASQNGRRNI
jgi:hypothetical protein